MESEIIISKDRFIEESIKENLFWLEILMEHAMFQSDALSPKETQLIREARDFHRTFKGLLAEVKRIAQEPRRDEVIRLNQQSQAETMRFIGFKKHMIELGLRCEISIALTPSFLNHMLEEGKRFLKVLEGLMRGRPQEPCGAYMLMEAHNLWIPDSLGHANFLLGSLDLSQRNLADRLEKISRDFCHLYINRGELDSILKVLDYPDAQAIYGLNEESKRAVMKLIALLRALKTQLSNCKVLATVNPLIIDHMIREANYYLSNLEGL